MKRLAYWGLGVGFTAALVAGWRAIEGVPSAQAADPSATQAQGVPVAAAQATLKDVPIYLNGLGTVQAFNTAEIQAQVSGYLLALPAPEGAEVHQGDVVAIIDPRPYQAALDHAKAQRAEDAATLESAQLDLKRYQSLAQRSFAPVQQVDDQKATVNKNIAALAADDAAIETAQINLGFCQIHAPFDGRLSLHQIDIGNLVQSGGASGIISITQDKPIAVVFTLPEADLARVRDALTKGAVPVLVNANNDTRTLATGTLMTPNNTIDTSTGTISLKAKFDNADDHLWPGEFVNARVQVDAVHNAVTIPTLAVQHGPDGLFVDVIQPDQTVQSVAVKIGYEDGGQSIVTAGLTGHETVVLSGQSRVAPGMKVRVTGGAQAASGT